MVKCLTSLIIKLASGNKRITSVYPLQVESTNETIGPLQHCKDRDFSMHWYWIIDSSFIKYTHTYKNRLASRFSYIRIKHEQYWIKFIKDKLLFDTWNAQNLHGWNIIKTSLLQMFGWIMIVHAINFCIKFFFFIKSPDQY